MTTAKPLAHDGSAAAGGGEREIDLDIRSVCKRYGGLAAVDNASLSIRKGEIISFLGPSGCGKSTLLNMIAGFVDPDEGDIALRGRSLVNVPPHKRETGMVFQHYALFPHMRVAGNIAYGLEARNQPAALIRERVARMMSLLKLDGFEDRFPGELSGGQRQRVAVARALAVQPKVLLLDEALSALDKNLREEMQIELSLLLRKLEITTIMVTHDQAEAMALADRIAVMSDGRIEQLAAPRELYRQPRTAMVARFVGSGMVFPVDVLDRRPGEVTAQFYGAHFPLRGEASTGDRRLACVRASDLALGGAGSGGFACIVCDLNYKGPVTTVVVSPVSDPSRQFHVDHPGAPPALGERTEISIRDGWLLEEAPA